MIQCALQHKKIVQNNEVVTFSQWMVIRLNDEEGGMNDHQTIIIIYSQLLKLSRVKSNFHFWRPPQSSAECTVPATQICHYRISQRQKNCIHSFKCNATFVNENKKQNWRFRRHLSDHIYLLINFFFVSILWNILYKLKFESTWGVSRFIVRFKND